MVWNFQRGSEHLRCEIRDGASRRSHELVITQADGVQRIEMHPNRASLLRRQHELICAWKAQGWQEQEPEPASFSAKLTAPPR